MSKTATVRARVEPELKEKAEGVLSELGLNATTAITLYYEQIVRRHAIPFEISLPNVATLRAMRDAEVGVGLTRAQDAAALLAALDSDD
ncbi:MAG: type II toxin-antitoxin system RelB/DinJ family antitoxin [Gemmatimonadaceae bacterium]